MKSRFRLLLFVLLVSDCKYEEGPFISFVSLQNRVTGAYTIESVTQNGKDKMDSINLLQIQKFAFSWYPESQSAPEHGFLTVLLADTSYYTGWQFYDEKQSLLIGNYGCTLPPYIPTQFKPLPGFISDGTCQPTTWEIEKLTNCKLWLNITFDDTTIEVHFNKIKGT